MSEDGKRLMEIIKQRYIIASTPATAGNAGYETACVYYEGFRDAYRNLIANCETYKMKMERHAKELVVENKEG